MAAFISALYVTFLDEKKKTAHREIQNIQLLHAWVIHLSADVQPGPEITGPHWVKSVTAAPTEATLNTIQQ